MTNYRRKRKPEKAPATVYIINEDIEASKVRIIDEEAVMLGVFTMEEALALAEEQQKDLILINPKAEPPVVKLVQFSKFKYLAEKMESGVKSKAAEIKILVVSVRISENDLRIRANKAIEFMDKGMKVKLQVKMRGREKAYPLVAKETIELFLTFITTPYTFESAVQLEGDSYSTIIKTAKPS
jgi:translation initiation factor IF-3